MTYKSPLLLHKGSSGKQWRSSDKWSIGYRLTPWSICCRKCSLGTQGSQLLLPQLCYCGDKASLHYSFFVLLLFYQKKDIIHAPKENPNTWRETNFLEFTGNMVPSHSGCVHTLHMTSCIIHNFTLWFWLKAKWNIRAFLGFVRAVRRNVRALRQAIWIILWKVHVAPEHYMSHVGAQQL